MERILVKMAALLMTFYMQHKKNKNPELLMLTDLKKAFNSDSMNHDSLNS